MLKQNKNISGFSLIEVTIAIFVLSIGILGLLQAFPKGIETQGAIELQSVANNLAQEKMEEFASISYDDLSIGIIENKARMDDNQNNPFYKFQRTTEIEYIDINFQTSQNDVGLKKITVTVEWPSPIGKTTDSVSLVTIASRR